MKERKRKRLIRRKQLEDVPELIQHIQSLLPPKDAACTCVLSKTWLRAWSTNPTLRVDPTLRIWRPGILMSLIKEQESKHTRFIIKTIQRYHKDNISIMTSDLYFAIHEQKLATRVEKSIKSIASKSCLKELRLKIFGHIASFTVPDEIFSSENLNTLSIKLDYPPSTFTDFSLHINSNPLINCVNLRELELIEVHTSEEAFHNLISTCKLLETINLIHVYNDGLEKVKVNNLHRLQQLKIGARNGNIEISDVPSLGSFCYYASRFGRARALFEIGLIKSLRELYLEKVLFDDAISDMIKSKLPFLESLKLKIERCEAEIIDIRCVTLQRLEIESWVSMPIKVQVNALKLLKVLFHLQKSDSMPSLLFPTVAPEQIELGLVLSKPIDPLLFLKIRETLDLSSEFNIEIRTYLSAAEVQFKIEDVRTRVPFPATNVKSLCFHTSRNDDWGDNSVLLFDAFFSICQPMYVAACSQMGLKVAKYFLELVKKGARKKKTVKVYWRQSTYLRRNPFTQENGINGKWAKLTSASVRSLEETLPKTSLYGLHTSVSEFKLTWSSP